MYATDAVTVRWREAQLRPKRPWIEIVAPLASSAPSTSTPSSSMGGVTLEAVMVQLQHTDARLDTLNDKLCQVNTHVSRIAQWQARLRGFIESPSPSLEASEDEDDDGDYNDDDDDEDEDASSFGDNTMTT